MIHAAILSDENGAGDWESALEVQLKKLMAGHKQPIEFQHVRGTEIAAGILSEFDLIIVPGGSARRQFRELSENGRAELESYLRTGGGYVGICAGAYLAARRMGESESRGRLGFAAVGVMDSEHWERGYGEVPVKIEPGFAANIKLRSPRFPMAYANGPLLTSLGGSPSGGFHPVAYYDANLRGNPGLAMNDTIAAGYGWYGRGRVFLFSMHPDLSSDAGAKTLLDVAVSWASGRLELPR